MAARQAQQFLVDCDDARHQAAIAAPLNYVQQETYDEYRTDRKE